MRLKYIRDDQQLQTGDLIFTRARWYIQIFCRLFGVEFPHVGVMLNHNQMLDVRIGHGIMIRDIDELCEDYEAWRPNVLCTKLSNLWVDDYLDLIEYSWVKMIANAINMVLPTRFRFKCIGFSCTALANEIILDMTMLSLTKYGHDATPLDIERIKDMPDELDFFLKIVNGD